MLKSNKQAKILRKAPELLAFARFVFELNSDARRRRIPNPNKDEILILAANEPSLEGVSNTTMRRFYKLVPQFFPGLELANTVELEDYFLFPSENEVNSSTTFRRNMAALKGLQEAIDECKQRASFHPKGGMYIKPSNDEKRLLKMWRNGVDPLQLGWQRKIFHREELFVNLSGETRDKSKLFQFLMGKEVAPLGKLGKPVIEKVGWGQYRFKPPAWPHWASRLVCRICNWESSVWRETNLKGKFPEEVLKQLQRHTETHGTESKEYDWVYQKLFEPVIK